MLVGTGGMKQKIETIIFEGIETTRFLGIETKNFLGEYIAQ